MRRDFRKAGMNKRKKKEGSQFVGRDAVHFGRLPCCGCKFFQKQFGRASYPALIDFYTRPVQTNGAD
jgi:hypothetical protein